MRRLRSRLASQTTSPNASAPRTPESVFKAIVDAVCAIAGRAALSHYPSRRLWAARLHDRLTKNLEVLGQLQTELTPTSKRIREESATKQPPTTEKLFASIVPILLKHHASLLRSVLAASEPLPIYKMGDDGIEKSFQDFNLLLSSCRQYVDTALQDAYQLNELNPAEFNYAVMSSLSSFLELAPPSLHVPFLTEDLLNAVREFETNNKQQKFATSKIRRFQEVARGLVGALHPTFVPEPQEFLERVFRFSSDFAHAGFASTVVTSKESAGVYLGSKDGVFFPSTENYAEVQFLALKSCLFIFADVYLRAVDKAINTLLPKDVADRCATLINECISQSKLKFEWTGKQMHAWVSNDAMLRRAEIQFRCACQTWFAWGGQYFQFDLYCPSCGTVIRITRMREPFGYCVLPEGPCDVFGADSPRIDHLSEQLRSKLYQIWEEFREFTKTLPKSNVAPVLLVGDIEHFKMMLPPRNPQELTTFISNKAVQDGEGIPISCRCSFMSLWIPKRGSAIDHMTCWACGSSIRILGLEGDVDYIFGQVDGKTTLLDVQASKALPSWRLSDAQRNEIISNSDQNNKPTTSGQE
jgi:hypothetical protein